MMRYQRVFAGVLLSAVALSLAACSSPGSNDAAGDITIARAADVTSLLPTETDANLDIWMLQQTYQTLTIAKSDGSKTGPLLATSWEPAADGLSWTFHIRKDVTFHNGATLTAADVAWSLNFDRNESDTTNVWAALFEPIKDVTAVDPDTVRISLSSPWPALPDYLGMAAASIYPKDFAGHDIAYMRSHVIGTGPFKLGSWNRGQSLTIVKNTRYWQKSIPKLDKVTFTVVPDDNTRILQLKGGQTDIDEFPSPSSMASLKAIPDVVPAAFKSTKIVYANINTRRPGLSDPRVRRAMSLAIDRSSVIKTIYSGYGEPANSFIANTLPGYDKNVDGAHYDVNEAKQLIKAANATGLAFNLEVASGVSDRAQLAQVLQEAWGEIGLKATIKVVDPTAARSDQAAAKFDVQLQIVSSDVLDPMENLSYLVLTKNQGANSGYANPEVYAKAAQALVAMDTNHRDALLSSIQNTVADEAPIIPIVYQPMLYAYKSSVKGFNLGVLGNYSFPSTSVLR